MGNCKRLAPVTVIRRRRDLAGGAQQRHHTLTKGEDSDRRGGKTPACTVQGAHRFFLFLLWPNEYLSSTPKAMVHAVHETMMHAAHTEAVAWAVECEMVEISEAMEMAIPVQDDDTA